jgi:hypothetical protein
LFPRYTHGDPLRFFNAVPTWQTLVEALVDEKPILVEKENHLPKKGHLKGNEILIAPISSKIDWVKTCPRIAVELRRIGFVPHPHSKWEALMNNVRALAQKLNQ